ncbi:MAG TPA: DUF2318 domain-containing protein [Desulfobacteria bacterium]|nr:DUF2318 domain-containing protein [Desulfobacteria bacterium]
MSRNEKKSKFTEPQKSNNKLFIIAGLIIIALLAVGGYAVSNKSADTDANLVNVGATSYQTAEFAKLNATEESGNIVIDLNELKNKKSVTFDVKGISFSLGNGTAFDYLPLLAYVTPKGNIVVATSLCEPCSGINFHSEGNELVCNACGTRWSLEDLQGISGGCPQYPPDKVNYTVDGDKLIIKKADLENWKPRQV